MCWPSTANQMAWLRPPLRFWAALESPFGWQLWLVAWLEVQSSGTGRGADLCWALGGMICNFTTILPYFEHWWDEAGPRFFSRQTNINVQHAFKQIKWRPKKNQKQKGLHRNLKSFCPRNQAKTKKKVFTETCRVFVPEIKWRPSRKQEKSKDHPALKCRP